MASSLPTFPRVVFTIIEPISLVAGFVGAVIDPAWFIGEQAPQKNGIGASDNSIIVTWQLGNLYLLLAFIGVAVLSTTTEVKVVKAYLIALLLGDIGHVGFSSYGLGWERSMSPVKWNAMAWGNIAMTVDVWITLIFVEPPGSYPALRLTPQVGSTMNTRGATLRAEKASAQPQPSRVTRNTQRHNSVHSGSTPRITRTPLPAPETIRPKKGLQADPRPIRNAPHYARTSYSIPSDPQGPDDETEFVGDDNDDAQNEEVDGQVELTEDHDEEIQASLGINPARQRVLELSVPDLARAADSLFECIQEGNPDEDVFKGCLSIKRRAFYTIRAEYDALDQSDTEPFIDWSYFLNASSTQDQEVMVTQIARANVVTALDRLHGVQNNEASDIFPFLDTLNQVMPAFFTSSDEMFQEPECTLNLRTWLFVENMSQAGDDADYKDLLASLFCEDLDGAGSNSGKQGRDYAKLFAGNNFKSLGSNGDDYELCSSRVAEIIEIVKKNKKDNGVAQLKILYPLHELVDELQKCFNGLRNMLTYEESVRAGTEPQSPFHEQDVAYSQGDDFGSESQSIVRAGSQEAEPSLFVDQKSIRALQGGSRAGSTVPPSNQQLAVSRSGVPRDYRHHTNAELLRSPLPPARSYQLVTNGGNTHDRGRKRPRSAKEEDGEDAFETDTRSVNPAKREELRRRMPPPPRPEPVSRPPPRHVSGPPSSSGFNFPAFEQDDSQSTSQDASSQAASHPPSSAGANYEALRLEASQRRKEVRLQDPQRQQPRQRVQWSAHDSDVLTELIAKRHASWSVMESQDNHLFDYPRNQQAYRDRARNLKTEILSTDRNLPPGFDSVILGPKEIEKVKGVGKNPYRVVEDVDERGDPVNTELRPASMESTPF
ncbi:hypothetical protein FSARC_6280 [Fusarium sarcochroum]|uniref:DUF7704 domain-containing protein n=1 Tax=Fusarium sarcochroum TaxID=1208366 RepID=A0A8H4X9I4_9HYPO|nr:hypothetical protein FSARC_6280 [Fusarium sarcochroum]